MIYPSLFKSSLIRSKSIWMIAAVVFFVAGLTPFTAHAQLSRDFVIANSLMKQGNYADAIPIYEDLLKNNPSSMPIINNLLSCYSETKKYDQAIDLVNRFTRLNGENLYMLSRLGGLHFLNTDTTQALTTWQQTLKKFEQDVSVYREVAREMAERGLTDNAIDVYLEARSRSNNPYLYTNDLANLYLKKGDYSNTAKEWMLLIVDDPTRTNLVQRRLFRFDDDDLLDALIVEAEKISTQYNPTDFHYQSIKELLIWLYSERKLYRRALANAKALEQTIGQPNFLPVFNLALRMKSINEFQIALNAIEYYTSNSEHPFRAKAMEESVFMLVDWGHFLELQELVHPKKVTEKMLDAMNAIELLDENFPDYNASRSLDLLKAEIEMDYLFKADFGRMMLQKTEFSADDRYLSPQQNYLRGRVALFDGNFTESRIYLTRAKKASQTGDFSEKSSYYLGYGDFLNGEFEFSAIQFRALERINTSYYANNALKVRNWVQMGTEKDSILPELTLFTKIQLHYEQGKWDDALKLIDSMIETSSDVDLNAEAILVGFNILNFTSSEQAFSYVKEHQIKAKGSPGREKLLWFGALSAFQFLNEDSGGIEIELGNTRTSEEQMNTISSENNITSPHQITKESTIEMFESIVLEYPEGFYAQYARNYLRDLEISS